MEYVSLDGVIQAPGHAGEDPDGGFAHDGWMGPFRADHRRYNSRLYPTAGAFLLGRRTYETFAASWPTVTDPTDRIALALGRPDSPPGAPQELADRLPREWRRT